MDALKIVIVCEGGLVRDVYVNRPNDPKVDVVILDFDDLASIDFGIDPDLDFEEQFERETEGLSCVY